MGKLSSILKTFFVVLVLFLISIGNLQAQPSKTVDLVVAKVTQSKSDSSSLFGLDKLITVSLTMTAEAWEKATVGFG